MNHRHLLVSLLCLTVSLHTVAQKKRGTFTKDEALLKKIESNFQLADSQYRLLARNLPAGKFPKTYQPMTRKYEFSNSGWWCSGFYPGSLLYIYEATRDTFLYTEAMRILDTLEAEKNNKNTHDLGFMMYCSFGNALRLAPKPAYNDILLASARSLSTRFHPRTGCIRSWDSKGSDFLVIIDNMMNLELLTWASKQTGDSSFYHIATTHAKTTINNHFRPDNSSVHVVNYDTATGAVKQKRTAQGAADGSAWARGQAWGLYGYTMLYRETKDPLYLAQAKKIAAFLLGHPRLPGDKIPYWDFDAPGIPEALRDASAAAIMSAALFELCTYATGKSAQQYYRVAEKILHSLSGPDYLAQPGTNGGFLLKHGVGHFPQRTEVDVPLTYGDYYFLEAMHRYRQLP